MLGDARSVADVGDALTVSHPHAYASDAAIRHALTAAHRQLSSSSNSSVPTNASASFSSGVVERAAEGLAGRVSEREVQGYLLETLELLLEVVQVAIRSRTLPPDTALRVVRSLQHPSGAAGTARAAAAAAAGRKRGLELSGVVLDRVVYATVMGSHDPDWPPPDPAHVDSIIQMVRFRLPRGATRTA